MRRRNAILLFVAIGATAAALLWWSRQGGPSGVAPAGEGGHPAIANAPVPDTPTAARVDTADAGPPSLRLPPARVTRAPSAEAPGEVLGQVVSAATGAPVPGAEVTFAGPDGGALCSTADAEGRFTFRPGSAGIFQVAAVRATGFFPFGPEWGRSPISVSVAPGTRVSGLVIALLPAPELVGVVRSGEGAPVRDARVHLLIPRAEEAVLFPVQDEFTTDDRGAFRFRAIEGTTVEAAHPELGGARKVLTPEDLEARRVVLTLGSRPGTERWTAALAGRVLLPDGRGAAGARVEARSADSAYPVAYGRPDGHQVFADASGHFELRRLEPGVYDVTASSSGLTPARRFDVKAPAEGLVLALGRGATLRGRVLTEDGVPVTAFGVDLRWKKGPLQQLGEAEGTFVDPEGRYVFEGLREGAYVVHVFARGLVPSEQEVRVPEGATEVRADVVLRRGGIVHGTIRTNGTARPIEGARVSVEGFDAPVALGAGRRAVTDASGRFELEGIPSAGVSIFVEAPAHHSRVVQGVRPGQVEVLLTPLLPDAGETKKVELVGIGAVLKARGDALVIGVVVPGGGAAEAGLVPGDEIVSLDGVPVVEVGFEGAVNRIRGEVGTQLLLGVRKSGAPPVRTVTVTRRKIGA